jgi:hypothetical protein
MATIIPFRRHSGARRPAAKKYASPAKIVIFPGVRYERAGHQGSAPQLPARSNRKRREGAD